MDERREVLVNRMRLMRENIREWFDAIDHWNAAHPDEDPLDKVALDPGLVMARAADALDQSLAREAKIAAEEHGDA